jgi:hypothetical protein
MLEAKLIPMLASLPPTRSPHGHQFNKTEAFALALTTKLYEEGVSRDILRRLLSHIATSPPRRDFPYSVAKLMTMTEDLIIYGGAYFGTAAGHKYLLETGHHVANPIPVVTKIHIDLSLIVKSLERF